VPTFVGSLAERVKSRDLGSIPTLIVHVVAFLDKALYDDYLCLVASNKAVNSVVRSQRNSRKTRKWTTPKQERIRAKYSANVAFS